MAVPFKYADMLLLGRFAEGGTVTGRDFTAIFAAVCAVMVSNAGDQIVREDAPRSLVLHTHALDAKGQPGWFGTVTMKKSYVAYHLIPLYNPAGAGRGHQPSACQAAARQDLLQLQECR
jgi:hypothetical protein